MKGGSSISLTLEQYLALSVFDYDNLKPDDEAKAVKEFLDNINKDDNKKLIPELGVLSQIQNWVLIGYTKPRYFTNQLLYGII